MKADALISEIGGVREKFGRHLLRLNIKTVRDLLFHFPFRYDDFSRVVPAAELKIGESRHRFRHRQARPVNAQLETKNDDYRGRRRRRERRHQSRLVQPAVCRQNPEARPADQSVRKINPGKNGAYFSAPAYEIAGGKERAKHTAGLVPIYPETRGLTSRGIRYLISAFLSRTEKLPDAIPENVRRNAGLPEINEALRQIHFPKTPAEAEEAKKTIRF